ncbi:MAG: Transcriptional regulatory protein ZraR [Syntrophaceae bacterium PtaU1.Bin231]|nr:MAG: Transcriptional regulatory protein ZraR [Syntrophaceae bacterium PtaU1.Bin231]
MVKPLKISDIMVPVKAVSILDGMDEITAAFVSADLEILPVIDGEGRFAGALKMRDVLSIWHRGLDRFQGIGSCINRNVACFSPDEPFDRVSADSLPAVVLDEEDHAIGVVPTGRLSSLIAINKELEAIIDSSYDGIWVMDGEGVILRINKAGERISGSPARVFVGRNIRELVERGLIDQSAALLVMEKKERVTINQTVLTATGEAVLLVTANPVFDEEGRLVRIVTNTRDISELIRLRDQLAREKEVSRRYMTELVHLRTLQNGDSGLIFRSAAMQRIAELSSRIADVDSTVLITGESGTGKEIIARLIHRLGRGDKKPFITISCGAIPEQLLESELFGYEGGSFTGARREGKPGMFELAHTGTLFLDEIGELPLRLQVKLLTSLQRKEICRVGGTKPIAVDVRIIAATNKDLGSMLKDRTFREDLYYRLMVVPIDVPPLRQRKEDIPPLVHHFLAEFNKHFGFEKTISPPVMDRLVNYDWPGNVRELKNVVERMMVMSRGGEVPPDDLPEFVNLKRPLPKAGARLNDALAETEMVLLAETYKEHRSWRKVADVLGIDRSTVYRKVSKYHMK